MAIEAVVRCEEWFSYISRISELDNETREESKNAFENFRRSGIITADSYMADRWIFTDGIHKNVLIDLAVDELNFERLWEKELGCDMETFKIAMRVVITASFGLSLSELQRTVRCIRRFFGGESETVVIENIRGYEEAVIGLLELLPGESLRRSQLIERIEDYMVFAESKRSGFVQRKLSHYQSYLRMDDYLTRFWEEAEPNQRLLYFPVYLWWKLTMIVPLRPTEFILTPRNCLVEKAGKNYILLRRSRVKGTWKQCSYSIAEDYSLEEYFLPEDLAVDIQQYCQATENSYESDMETLFCKRTQFLESKICNPNDNHYTAENLRQCLSRFYEEILGKKYGLALVGDEREELGTNEIGVIRLGDTRHIALINLMFSGASLTTCKELSGHQNLSSAAHYYGNAKQFLDALSLVRYRENAIPGLMAKLDMNGVQVRGGLCYSPRIISGDFGDCACAVDAYGYPGSCECCPFYFAGSTASNRQYIENAANEVKYTCELLRLEVEALRKDLGKEEQIFALLERLHGNALVYINKKRIANINKPKKEIDFEYK